MEFQEEYFASLVSELTTDLAIAEHSRGRGNFVDAIGFYRGRVQSEQRFAFFSPLKMALEAPQHSYFVSAEKVAVALLGLSRIAVDSATSLYEKKFIDERELREILNQVTLLAGELHIDDRAPWTASGAIHWGAEFDHDRGRALAAMGDKTTARQVYGEGVTLAESTLENSGESLNQPYLVSHETNPQLYIEQRRAVGALWALAELCARLGRLDNNLSLLVKGLRAAREARHYEENKERLELIAAWNILGVFRIWSFLRYPWLVPQAVIMGLSNGGSQPLKEKATTLISSTVTEGGLRIKRRATKGLYAVLRRAFGHLPIDDDVNVEKARRDRDNGL
ncbi:MAG TPA: hypothetical protein VD999_01535 [Vitreimonas sp.]|nr:hypothetical protein [Vitreimonas sp.]